jgi:hypothetical protein
MAQNVQTLRTDQYPSVSAFVLSPPNYNLMLYGSSTAPADRIAFVYASKRYQIPFGWNANPLPNLSATGWALCNYYNFNPFNPYGDYEVNPYINVFQKELSTFHRIYDTDRVERIRNLKIEEVRHE